ncbi:AurF N-oxygenase family protein [Aeromicrobium sp. CF3.5]|uniref:AurF N-oxygenase family protein n=1 Tax=Aeromicrobium sp. CF3.5 TaxID=3373078 RepID=UPI003EE60067
MSIQEAVPYRAAADLPELPEMSPHMTREEYHRVLEDLSQASVDRHFDAFRDIAWDHPDFQVDPTDTRWVLPKVDRIGSSQWYQAQPLDQQIRIGMWRQANIMKVGLQFEQILIRGIMQYVFTLPNGSPEFRYLTHEATEECHHTQMFQEGVNRIGVDVPGMPWWMRKVGTVLPWFGSLAPFAFFVGVLAGEEPIDHTQKRILRNAQDMPPVIKRIMQIHVAEEARHISFAHHYILTNAPRLNWAERHVMTVMFPLIMRVLGDTILVPPREMRTEFGIPKSVMKDLYWRSPESRDNLSEIFADVRMLATEAGLMTRVGRFMWRILKIDGRSSRFRSEPAIEFSSDPLVDGTKAA